MKKSDFTYYDYMTSAPESGKFIFTVMESFPQGIIIVDNQEKIIYANPKITHLTGYSRKELLGKVAYQFLYFQHDQKKLEEIISQKLSGVYETYELYIKRVKGLPFLAHTITAPYKNVDGQVIGTINIINDITVEEGYKEFQALAIAATKSLNSVIILDKFCKIAWVNEGFTKLTGYELYEVIDTKGEILMTEGFDSYLKVLEEVISKKLPARYERKYLDKEHKEHLMISTLTPILDPYGDVKNIVVVDTEISRRHQF